MSDTMGACAVLISFGAVALGWGQADMVGALLVAILIGRTAFMILRANLGVLADHAQSVSESSAIWKVERPAAGELTYALASCSVTRAALSEP